MGVPIFVGTVQDGSIFLNVVKLRAMLGDAFKLEIDIAEDVLEMGAVQHHCFSTLRKKMAIWILGGGVPKNYTLQGEPLLDQILGVPTRGFDVDVQFCVDPVDNGALSSCPAGEGHTWGKVGATISTAMCEASWTGSDASMQAPPRLRFTMRTRSPFAASGAVESGLAGVTDESLGRLRAGPEAERMARAGTVDMRSADEVRP